MQIKDVHNRHTLTGTGKPDRPQNNADTNAVKTRATAKRTDMADIRTAGHQNDDISVSKKELNKLSSRSIENLGVISKNIKSGAYDAPEILSNTARKILSDLTG